MLGCIMFLIVGGLIIASVDQVPSHLVDNAIALGVLSIITGVLFLLDLGIGGSRARGTGRDEKRKQQTLTLSEPTKDKDEEADRKDGKDGKADKTMRNGFLKELRSSLKRKKQIEDLDGRGVVVEKTVDFKEEPKETARDERERRDSIEIQENASPRQYGRRRLENRGFPRSPSSDGDAFPDRFPRNETENGRLKSYDREYDSRDQRHMNGYSKREVSDYDRRNGRTYTERMEVELDEQYLRPRDQYVEKRLERRIREERVQDHRVSSSSRPDFSDGDDDYHLQIPSVSFLLADRGKKVLPSVSTSPIERVNGVVSTSPPKTRYYFNSTRDTSTTESSPKRERRQPGYVLNTASNWPSERVEKTFPTTVSDRLHNWFRDRQQSKPPP